ncbi:DNAJ domain, putative [Babesia ovis]|uniref:DNAJ domain, putative n=1 Tax=Babesia ovis TaxID=5869 RepID=A0A9W5T9U9_BABOV|nr:DNAJ domain, putative [Babesia ovis]
MEDTIIQDLANIAAGSLSPNSARLRMKEHEQSLTKKMERKRTDVKSTMRVLRQYKNIIASRVDARRTMLLEKKNELDTVMADYRMECRKLAEEDAKELHEFYLWAKDEIVKCAKTAAERAPVEDNTEILKALNIMLKNC